MSDTTHYEEKHYYENQKVFDNGIPINPVMRTNFDMTPNECRDPREKRDWWYRAFIVTNDWDKMSKTWKVYKARSEKLGVDPGSKKAFTQRQEELKRSWFDAWQTGTRYDVMRLDGGAWDRSTSIALVPNLEQALYIAKACDQKK